MIYKALIKYGYLSFKLDILEYCNLYTLISRKQYYINSLNFIYNNLKFAGSLTGFKHSEASIEFICTSKLSRNRTEETELKIATSSVQAHTIIVINNNTGEIIKFTFIRKAFEFVGKHYFHTIKCLIRNKFYKNNGYYITKKLI
jgi:hypothetical protein